MRGWPLPIEASAWQEGRSDPPCDHHVAAKQSYRVCRMCWLDECDARTDGTNNMCSVRRELKAFQKRWAKKEIRGNASRQP